MVSKQELMMFQERVQQVKDKIQTLIQTYKAKHPNRFIPETDLRTL